MANREKGLGEGLFISAYPQYEKESAVQLLPMEKGTYVYFDKPLNIIGVAYMNNEELIASLRYLIMKYIPLEKSGYFESFLSLEDIPVKGILADFNEFSQRKVEEIDGDLIRKIYFHFC